MSEQWITLKYAAEILADGRETLMISELRGLPCRLAKEGLSGRPPYQVRMRDIQRVKQLMHVAGITRWSAVRIAAAEAAGRL